MEAYVGEITPIPAIIIISYFSGMVFKKIPQIKDDLIPILVGIVGGILGTAAFYTVPDFPACSPLTAQAIGIGLGLGSTGIHQACKQNMPEKEKICDCNRDIRLP